RLIITILVILLIIAGIYIAVLKVQSYCEDKSDASYKEGAQFGYEMSIKQLLSEMEDCKPVEVHADNLTVNVIAVECLQQPEMPELPTPEELEEQRKEEQAE
ncbi:hypothetical protein KY336_03960, partial [Candidatus Woesearchaeota archaeon]|nr:hypothetical protein [Candidatus Woesearchaeota archaeon]